MNDLYFCLEVVSRSCQPLRYIWRWIYRKPLQIEAWFQRTTNRKWHMGYQIVTWPMTSRDPQRCCESVRSAILATAWLLVSSCFDAADRWMMRTPLALTGARRLTDWWQSTWLWRWLILMVRVSPKIFTWNGQIASQKSSMNRFTWIVSCIPVQTASFWIYLLLSRFVVQLLTFAPLLSYNVYRLVEIQQRHSHSL